MDTPALRVCARALLWTGQTKQMLDIVQAHVRREGYDYRRLDGTTAVGLRLQLIDEFNSDDSADTGGANHRRDPGGMHGGR